MAVSATVLEETVEGVALARVLDDIRPEAVVICEPSDLAVQVGQRGRAELLVTVTGTPAHAAYPNGARTRSPWRHRAWPRWSGSRFPPTPISGRPSW